MSSRRVFLSADFLFSHLSSLFPPLNFLAPLFFISLVHFLNAILSQITFSRRIVPIYFPIRTSVLSFVRFPILFTLHKTTNPQTLRFDRGGYLDAPRRVSGLSRFSQEGRGKSGAESRAKDRIFWTPSRAEFLFSPRYYFRLEHARRSTVHATHPRARKWFFELSTSQRKRKRRKRSSHLSPSSRSERQSLLATRLNRRKDRSEIG